MYRGTRLGIGIGLLVLLGGCMHDLTGYSYSRGEVAGQAWTDVGTVIAVEVIRKPAESFMPHEEDNKAEAHADSRRVVMTVKLNTGANITVEQRLDLMDPIQRGDRVTLISEGGVTRAVIAVPLMNRLVNH